MPVEKDVNLDNPDGLTQEDIDLIKRQAEELELYAENVEQNVEKVEKASKQIKESLSGMNLYQQDMMRSGPAQQGNPMGAMGGAVPANGGGASQEEMQVMIADILKEMKKAEKERRENKLGLTEAQKARKELEGKIAGTLSSGEEHFNQVQAIGSDPFGVAKGKILGMVGKAGIYGFIALMVYRVAEQIWNEYMATFKPGGPNDIRKMMEDRDKEIAELSDILARNEGRVFFTADVTLGQGAPQMSNTERLRDGVMRYNALHLGE
jgi:hypothetical protein